MGRTDAGEGRADGGAGDGMEYGEVAPAPELAGYVRCLWWLRGRPDPEAGAPVEGIVPDGRPELVLNLADPFLHHPREGDRSPVEQPAALLVGQITRPMLLAPADRVDLVGVRFHAPGLHALAGLPMRDLVDGWVEAGGSWPEMRGLRQRLGALGSPGERIGELQGVLRRLVDPGAATSPVRRAERLIRRNGGRVRVDDVAVAVGLGPRQLRRRFHVEAGLGPKTLARIARFQTFLGLVARRPPGGMARAAVEAGYYDQAHLIRDFRELAGATPVRYLQESRSVADHFLEGESRDDGGSVRGTDLLPESIR